MRSHLRAAALFFFFTAIVLAQPAEVTAAASQDQGAPGAEGETHELYVTAGKSVIVTSLSPIQRVAVGFGDVAEATAVGPREVLLSGRAPGSTSLIVWQENGEKLFFNVTVRPNTTATGFKLEALRRELRQELPGQKITASLENETVFLRGTVKDLTSSDRAVAIASTLAKTVNLLYVNVPAAESQILLKVRFASVDRSASSELGLNLLSTGATNTIGSVSTQQFSPPRVEQNDQGGATLTLSDALNIFLIRPDLNLAATIRALQKKSLLEILAEPNVLASDGKPASFLAGGEYPYPILQGGGAGLGTVTIQFREFGVRINFLPNLTPRGSIRLDVAPEVSSLDFANGLAIQGFTIPGLSVRRVRTQIELAPGQSFAIGGLLDRRLTETLQRIPVLGDVPLLGRIFRSRAFNQANTELLVIVTPELVQPMPAGQPLPQLEFPKAVMGPDKVPQTPGVAVTGTTAPPAPAQAIPVEQLLQSIQKADRSMGGTGAGGVADSSWQPQTQLPQPSPSGAGAGMAPEPMTPKPVK